MESPPVETGHVVVLIDDDPAVLGALQRVLRGEPYEVVATQNPEEALHWVLSRRASLIVADQRMPGMTGLELLEMVRTCSPRTARVMLTAHSDLSGVFKISRIEAIDRVLRKPWEEEGLKGTLRELLAAVEAGRGGSGRAPISREGSTG